MKKLFLVFLSFLLIAPGCISLSDRYISVRKDLNKVCKLIQDDVGSRSRIAQTQCLVETLKIVTPICHSFFIWGYSGIPGIPLFPGSFTSGPCFYDSNPED